MHNADDRLPARRHFRHDGFERVARFARLRLHRVGAGVEDQGRSGRSATAKSRSKRGSRDPEHQPRCAEHAPDIVFHERPRSNRAAADGERSRVKRKKTRHHEERGHEDADRDEHAELGEAGRAGEQEQGEEADRRGQGAEKNRAAEFRDGFLDRRGVRGPFVPRLLVTAENQNREVDPESDEDRAETDRDHVELAENEQARRRARRGSKGAAKIPSR